METYGFLRTVAMSIARLMPPGLSSLVQILMYVFFTFTVLSVFYAIVMMLKALKGLIFRA